MDSVVNSSTLVSIGRDVGQHFSENVLARFGPESLAFLNRNDWLLCAGLGGVFGPECAANPAVTGLARKAAQAGYFCVGRPLLPLVYGGLSAGRGHLAHNPPLRCVS